MAANPFPIEEYEKIDPIATVQFEGKKIHYFTPSKHTLWRVNSLFQKEPDTMAWISGFQANDILLDVGANVGMYTIWAAATRGCRVYSFEPESQNFALLNKNIYANQLADKVTAFCVALSDETAYDVLNLSHLMPGGSCHTFKEQINFKLEEFEPSFKQGCFATTLDTMIADGVMPVPNHIKIDVDGIEHRVIAGMAETLKRAEVKSLLIEINTNLELHQKLIKQMTEEYGFIYREEEVKQHIRQQGTFEGVGNYIFYREAA